MDGIIVAFKPGGMTSHDVVSFIRKQLGEKRVGHGGTLDPQARGVLPLFIGRATGIVRFAMELEKGYRAEITFGAKTSTDDAWGQIRWKAPPFRIPKEDVVTVLRRFTGRIRQLPPMVSAVHHEGKRLYELAWKGKEVAVAPREVEVYRLEPLEWSDDEGYITNGSSLTVEVICSKGTYIRSIARDVGEALGCGGYLSSLVRTSSCGFQLEDAHTLEEISTFREHLREKGILLPMDAGLGHLARLTLGGKEANLVSHGGAVWLEEVHCPIRARKGMRVRAYSEDGQFLAVLEVARVEEGGRFLVRPLRVFV